MSEVNLTLASIVDQERFLRGLINERQTLQWIKGLNLVGFICQMTYETVTAFTAKRVPAFDSVTGYYNCELHALRIFSCLRGDNRAEMEHLEQFSQDGVQEYKRLSELLNHKTVRKIKAADLLLVKSSTTELINRLFEQIISKELLYLVHAYFICSVKATYIDADGYQDDKNDLRLFTSVNLPNGTIEKIANFAKEQLTISSIAFARVEAAKLCCRTDQFATMQRMLAEEQTRLGLYCSQFYKDFLVLSALSEMNGIVVVTRMKKRGEPAHSWHYRLSFDSSKAMNATEVAELSPQEPIVVFELKIDLAKLDFYLELGRKVDIKTLLLAESSVSEQQYDPGYSEATHLPDDEALVEIERYRSIARELGIIREEKFEFKIIHTFCSTIVEESNRDA